MKITCKYCGVVDKPHKCPHAKPYKRVDKNRSDKKIYRTTRYQALRRTVFDDYNNICLWSLYVQGRVTTAQETHHIVEVLEDESLAYEYDNLIPLEYYNHVLIHELYKKDKVKIQRLLRQMCVDYQNGDRTLGKYKDSV